MKHAKPNALGSHHSPVPHFNIHTGWMAGVKLKTAHRMTKPELATMRDLLNMLQSSQHPFPEWQLSTLPNCAGPQQIVNKSQNSLQYWRHLAVGHICRCVGKQKNMFPKNVTRTPRINILFFLKIIL